MNKRLAVAVSIALALFVFAPWSRADESWGKAHVILVGDTLDDKIGESVNVDLGVMNSVIALNLPERYYTLKIFKEDQATWAQVTAYLEQLDVTNRDAVVLLFSGHGAWYENREQSNENPGHCLQFRDGLHGRSDLLNRMKKKKGRLTVLLTDCCSVILPGASLQDRAAFSTTPKAAAFLSPVLRDLFFYHDGVVDITAAEKGTFAACNKAGGGYFTRALSQVLLGPPRLLNLNGDKFVSWEEVFFWTQAATGQIAWSNNRWQKPHAFELGQRRPPLLQPPLLVEVPAKTIGLTLHNPTNHTLNYSLSWIGKDGPWDGWRIPPGCGIRHWYPLGAEEAAPFAYIKYERSFQGDPFPEEDKYQLAPRPIDRNDITQLGECYGFAEEWWPTPFGRIRPLVRLYVTAPPRESFPRFDLNALREKVQEAWKTKP